MMMTYLKHSQRFGSREVSNDSMWLALSLDFFFFERGGGEGIEGKLMPAPYVVEKEL